MRKIHLSFQKNIRDLGGLVGYNDMKVKYGVIYRGGFLGKVSDEDIKIIESLHLTDVIDFRGSHEFNHRPDYRFTGVTYHNIPSMKEDVAKEKSKSEDSNLLWFLGDNTDGFKHMYELYPELVLEEVGIKAMRKFFRILTGNPGHVFYFHCSQGKDRAGLAAYLLEIALGVSPEDAKADYLRSNEAMKVRIEYHINQLKNKKFYNEEYEKNLKDVFSAKEEYLDHALQGIADRYSSVENYLINELHVDILKLRALYLGL